MRLERLISVNRIQILSSATSRKLVLEQLGSLLSNSQNGCTAEKISRELFARERLGSTGIGQGIAIPHIRSSECHCAQAALLRLASPIEFNAFDDQPVDLFFAFIVPKDQTDLHLQILKSIIKHFKNQYFINQCRKITTAEEILNLLSQPSLIHTLAVEI